MPYSMPIATTAGVIVRTKVSSAIDRLRLNTTGSFIGQECQATSAAGHTRIRFAVHLEQWSDSIS